MKRHNFILTIFLTLTFGTAFAHQDFWRFMDYDNVKVRVKTGYEYEEINKAFVIGKLAVKLAKELNYSDPIFLDFEHHYTGDCYPAYFISYDKGKIEYTWESASKEENYLKTNAIVVRQVNRQFNVIATLSLLEYAIKNIYSIKESQKQIEYNQNYCEWKINSIDTSLIKEQLLKPSSDLLKRILKNKIERPAKDLQSGISYFWQDNLFIIYDKDFNNSIRELFTIKNIYDFVALEDGKVIFDTDSSFYFIETHPFSKNFVTSSKQIIDNKKEFYNYKPFRKDDILYYYLTNKIKKE